MKRIFIAIKVEPGEKLLKMISSVKTRLSSENIKWVSIDNIHITLTFLGDTEDEQIRIINEMLKVKCAGSGKFEILIKSIGVFKNLNDPRIIWTGIEQCDKLSELNILIKKGLADTGIKLEEHAFKPHLTLGRIKNLKSGNALKEIIEEFRDAEFQKVTVKEVILYESILLPAGPVYKIIDKVVI